MRQYLDTRYVRPRQHGRLRPVFPRELNQFARRAKRYTGLDESAIHRGLSGFGHGVPGDRSTDAAQVYLTLVVWWRFVARQDSVTQLRRWVGHALGPARAGERKRTEKIYQRIGLKFRPRGRLRKNPTPPAPR